MVVVGTAAGHRPRTDLRGPDMNTFDADGHLTPETIDALAEQQLDADAEARVAGVRRRILAYAVAPWWQRAWWRITRRGPA